MRLKNKKSAKLKRQSKFSPELEVILGEKRPLNRGKKFPAKLRRNMANLNEKSKSVENTTYNGISKKSKV